MRETESRVFFLPFTVDVALEAQGTRTQFVSFSFFCLLVRASAKPILLCERLSEAVPRLNFAALFQLFHCDKRCWLASVFLLRHWLLILAPAGSLRRRK